MKTIDNLNEMAAALPIDIYRSIRTIIDTLEDYWDNESASEISFSSVFDSSMFVVEEIEDLALIFTFEEGPNGRLSVQDTPSKWFDTAYWTEDGAFAVLGTIETSVGGPQYFIPRAIADQVPNVAESIRLKHEPDGAQLPCGGGA